MSYLLLYLYNHFLPGWNNVIRRVDKPRRVHSGNFDVSEAFSKELNSHIARWHARDVSKFPRRDFPNSDVFFGVRDPDSKRGSIPISEKGSQFRRSKFRLFLCSEFEPAKRGSIPISEKGGQFRRSEFRLFFVFGIRTREERFIFEFRFPKGEVSSDSGFSNPRLFFSDSDS